MSKSLICMIKELHEAFLVYGGENRQYTQFIFVQYIQGSVAHHRTRFCCVEISFQCPKELNGHRYSGGPCL